MMAFADNCDYDVVVVGAGFGGIRSLWEIRKLGFSVKCYEAGSDVGGAWYWNRYPGARTDSEAWVYNLNFTPELKDEWTFAERYPSQIDIQRNLSEAVDRYDLRKSIQFNTRVKAAQFNDRNDTWIITTTDGRSAVCRYFIPATGPLSVGRQPPFPGLKSYQGEWYMAAEWPQKPVDFRGKRIAVVGTGASGVQIIPKIAPVAKSLTVFQRTPNFVLPGRNYNIDEHQLQELRESHSMTWKRANEHGFGLAMATPEGTFQDARDTGRISQILDAGWEEGGFHFQFETFSDIFTNSESNHEVSEYLRNKIRTVVRDEVMAELLCPKYPFLSKRPPCGHFYYEAFNRANVSLVDISTDTIDLYKHGIHTRSGGEYEFDMVIFAIGFDAATGALTEMDVRGREGGSLKDVWAEKLRTFGGVFVPGFPNMFMVTGPHVPFGNMPIVIDANVDWIGRALAYLQDNNLVTMDVSEDAVEAWSQHVDDAFEATLFAETAKANHAWFVGANIPGKPSNVLFYFGGVPTWFAWLRREIEEGWPSMTFAKCSNISPSPIANGHSKNQECLRQGETIVAA